MSLVCPTCGKPTRVLDTRGGKDYIRRRRICDKGHRFTTHELSIGKQEEKGRKVKAVILKLLKELTS